jgi:integrase
MAKGYGTGSITEIDKGKRYRVRAFMGKDPITGRSRFASRNVRGTKTEARAVLNQMLGEVAEKRTRGTTTTLRVAMLDWLEHAEALGRAPTTLDQYQMRNAKWITPLLGNLPLNKLDTYSIDQFVVAMSDKLAPATVSTNLAILKAALAQFVVWGWISENPALRAKAPRMTTPERTALTAEQVVAIIRSSEDEDPDRAALLAVTALAGLRRGEACGLRWSDVDWEGKRIVIERALVPTNDGQIITATKTGRSRSVHVDQALDILAAHYNRQIDIYGAVFPDGYVFGIDGGSIPPRAKTLTQFFTRHARKCGLNGVRFHDLRHFAVTNAIAAGTDVDTASRQFGHSKEVMLNVYSHGSEDMARAMASRAHLPLDATKPPDRGAEGQ